MRTSYNQLPSIERKVRVGSSSGYVTGKANSNFSSSMIGNEDVVNSPRNEENPTFDPFIRVNKFKNAVSTLNHVKTKSQGIKKPRYSHQENINPQHFSSAAPGHFPQVTEPDIIASELNPGGVIPPIKKLTSTIDVSLIDIVHQGKNSN